MTASKIDRILDALVEQDAVRYATVTDRGGNTVAEAGDLPTPAPEATSPEAVLEGGSGTLEAAVQTMVEVGDGRILQLGTTEELPEDELRQLRSLVASAM